MGKTEKLEALRAWLMENMPQTPDHLRSMNFLNKKSRVKVLVEKAKKFKQRTRISLTWRNELSDRLKIKEDDILRATNTILEMIEQTLASGKRVRLHNFGDFKTITVLRDDMVNYELRFSPAEEWQREINQPIFESSIGLKRKYTKKKLQRREL
jgi:hypothetical protein